MNDDIDAEELLRRYSNGERVFVEVCLTDGAVLKGADLQGAIFQDGFFSDVDARRANLPGAKFRNMNLKCTDFRGADLTDLVRDQGRCEDCRTGHGDKGVMDSLCRTGWSQAQARAGESDWGETMRIDQVNSYEDLERYLREFTNYSGDPVPYDFNGAFHLFLAILDNLANHSLDADVEDLEEGRPWITEKHLDFLRKVERLA